MQNIAKGPSAIINLWKCQVPKFQDWENHPYLDLRKTGLKKLVSGDEPNFLGMANKKWLFASKAKYGEQLEQKRHRNGSNDKEKIGKPASEDTFDMVQAREGGGGPEAR